MSSEEKAAVEEDVAMPRDEEEEKSEVKKSSKRVRKSVDVFGYAERDNRSNEEWRVREGKGLALSGMEGVCLQISRLKANDVLLKTMHTMFFQKPGKKTTLRKNLRAFSGFPEEGEELIHVQSKARAKLEKLPMPQVKRLMDTLLIDRSAASFEDSKISKDGLVERVLEWITKPTEPTKKAPVSLRKKAKKKPKKKAKKKKPEKTGPKKALSAYMFFCKSKRAEVVEANPELKGPEVFKKMGDIWKAYGDEEKKPFVELAEQDKERYQHELAEAPPAKKKRKSTAKSPAKKKTKKRKVVVQNDSDSSDDDDMSFIQIEIKAKLEKILSDPKLDRVNLGIKGLRKMLAEQMNTDLKPYKSFIKAQVISIFQEQ